MTTCEVRKTAEHLAKEDQAAWKLNCVAVDRVLLEAEAHAMIGNRGIEKAAVEVTSAARWPNRLARILGQAHSQQPGAAVFGQPLKQRFSPEWTAQANGVAVRELDYHDTLFATDYSYPGDSDPPILDVVQTKGLGRTVLVRGVDAGYELKVGLVKGISLHVHKSDGTAQLRPPGCGGESALLALDLGTTYPAIQQARHVTPTRKLRTGGISSWNAFAPVFAGKPSIKPLDRAMRGDGAPSPALGGNHGFVARPLGGPTDRYKSRRREPGEPNDAILEPHTQLQTADYQSGALIDLGIRNGEKRDDTGKSSSVVLEASHHTRCVISAGANELQKSDLNTSRQTVDRPVLDESAIALQDRASHHDRGFVPGGPGRPDAVESWHKVSTTGAPEWVRCHHSTDTPERTLGARRMISFSNDSKMTHEYAVANACPHCARPFGRDEHEHKLGVRADAVVERCERNWFLELAECNGHLSADAVARQGVVGGDRLGDSDTTTGVP